MRSYLSSESLRIMSVICAWRSDIRKMEEGDGEVIRIIGKFGKCFIFTSCFSSRTDNFYHHCGEMVVVYGQRDIDRLPCWRE